MISKQNVLWGEYAANIHYKIKFKTVINIILKKNIIYKSIYKYFLLF